MKKSEKENRAWERHRTPAEQPWRTYNIVTPLLRIVFEDRRRTGRYVAGGTALAVTLLGLYHLFLRGASTIAGVCVPAIIMASYIIWVLYSARRDRRKALRYAMAMQLTEVINVPSKSTSEKSKSAKNDDDFERNPSNPYKSRSTRENPAFSDKDEM